MNQHVAILPPLTSLVGHDAGRVAPEVRWGAGITGVFVAATVIAACVVPLDAAVVAPGTVRVAGERQTIASSVEGSIATLAVSEGQHVKPGQMLVQLSTEDLLAPERELASHVIGLQAEIAKLEAKQVGASQVAAPAAFAGYRGDDRLLADKALASEQTQLGASVRALAAQQAVLRQRIAKINEQARGSTARRAALDRQRALLGQELTGIEELAARGYASKNRVLQMRRSDADLQGTTAALSADRAQLEAGAGEARLQIEQARATDIDEAGQRLRQARNELAQLLPQWTAARQRLHRTRIVAGYAGSIVDLRVHSPGGFVRPGEPLFDLVPDDRSLTVEARVGVGDANAVEVGKPARLRLAAWHGRNAPTLEGRVSAISADSLTDERTGQAYYRMAVRIPAPGHDRPDNGHWQIRPGNAATVTVTTRQRSALAYWLEPLWQSMQGSLHED